MHQVLKDQTWKKSGNLYELETPPQPKKYIVLRILSWYWEVKTEKQTLDAWCHFNVTGRYQKLMVPGVNEPPTPWLKKAFLVTFVSVWSDSCHSERKRQNLPSRYLTGPHQLFLLTDVMVMNRAAQRNFIWKFTQCSFYNNVLEPKGGSKNCKSGFPFN